MPEISTTPPFATLEDSALISLALAGQTECFTILMDRHLAIVRKRVRSLIANPTDAEDVIQEVQLKVWRHLSSFRSASSFRTWMTRVAINEALQSHRQAQRRPACLDIGSLDVLTSPGESPFQSFARSESAQAVHSALGGLPLKFRQVLILRDLRELSVKETAQCLRSSVPLVKTRHFRARLMLSEAIRRQQSNHQHVQRKKSRMAEWSPGLAA
ncbi:MAG TPA: sigma-70 family RNA polymerase sigma factor [Bryobacteraceae bacterium]|jgi:RNA polymerase sigma-70 factor (ECF subfamily)|nr:sigma-70 family RNA polymerase sigma factor [Bryobacteraceae bacterium]